MFNLDDVIKAGLVKLRELQLPDGSFSSYASVNPDFSERKETSSIFPDFFILSSVASLKGEFDLAEKIGNGLAGFILSQKSDQWSFNYWKRGSKNAVDYPYPDDLDSTSCAFSSLHLYNQDLISGEAIGAFAMMLSAEEADEGGPYYTWLTSPDAKEWKDIDPAVNANIGYALSLEEVRLKSLDSLAEKEIAAGKYISPYYASSFSVAYLISRFYSGPKKNRLADWLLKNISDCGNPLDFAFCVKGLLNLNVRGVSEICRARDELARFCLFGGGVYPFVIDASGEGERMREYSGSEALCLALSLEALSGLREKPKESRLSSMHSGLDNIFSKVSLLAKSRFGLESGEIGSLFHNAFNKITEKKDGKEIILVASIFASAVNPEKRPLISDDYLAELGFINLCGWIAYTIYDDFIDGGGDPKLLPVANVCLREVAAILKNVEIDNSFSYCRDVLDGIDAANLWETTNARSAVSDGLINLTPSYGNFENLASRSLGHAIGPLMVLFSLGFDADSDEIKNIRRFFSDYIIARQLNDDIRDWEDDLRSGRLSPAVARLIHEAKISDKEILNLNSDMPFLRDLFWKRVIPVMAEESIARCRSASEAVNLSGEIISSPEILLSILSPVKKSAESIIRDQKTTLDFLNAIDGNRNL